MPILPDGEEHAVTLRCNPTRPSGLDLSEGDGFALRVKSVDNSGAIGDWNRDHPSQKVMSGDIIVDVNGKCRNSHMMLLEIKDKPNLHLVVRHIPETSRLLHMMQYRDLDAEDFELLCSLDEVRMPKVEGTVRKMLDQLQRVEASRCQSNTCWICLDTFAPNAWVTQLPCGHAFCTGCIEEWVSKCKSSCPICQNSIDEGLTHQCSTRSPSETNDDDFSLETPSETDDECSVCKEVDKYGLRFAENPLPRLALGGATRGRSFSVTSKKAWL